MKYVVPGLIDEEVIYYLPPYIMDALAKLCSDIVIQYINDYCKENENSDDEVTKACVEKLNKNFAAINAKKKYLRSKNAKNIVDTLNNLSYIDIYYQGEQSLETLSEYKYCIETVLDSTKDIGKARVVTNSDWENFITGCETYKKIATDNNSEEELRAVERIRKIVKNNKSMFKSAPFAVSGSTVFTKFLNKRGTLETLLYGINFLMNNIKEGKSPESWRYL